MLNTAHLRTRYLPLLVSILTLQGIATAPAQAAPAFQKTAPWTAPARKARAKNPVEDSAEALERGRALFEINCVACHGAKGKGNGAAAFALTPKPSDLTAPSFHAQSDGSMYWKLSKGRSPMPAFDSAMTDTERWEIVLHLRTLGDPPTPVAASLDAYAQLKRSLELGDAKAFKGAAKSLGVALTKVQDPSQEDGLSKDQAEAMHKAWERQLASVQTNLKAMAARKADWAAAPARFLATTKVIVEMLDMIPADRLPTTVVLWKGAMARDTDELWIQWGGPEASNPYSAERRKDATAVRRWPSKLKQAKSKSPG